MTGAPYLRAQAGDDSERWTTFGDRIIVLAVARTFTSTTRLLEALAVFADDDRIQVVFTFDDTSAFNAGTGDLLRGLDVCLLPWEEARKAPARIVITASENVDLRHFTAPVVVLPHGVGFQKYVPDSEGDSRRLSGVVREEFTRNRNIHTVVSHAAQRDQLRPEYPVLAENARVIGDPVYDRLRASVRKRDLYRERLGVGERRRLVVLSSTWGDQGLLAQRPYLAARLLAALPHDRYRVAAILHPNIWFAHSPWQVRHWLRSARAAGLLLIPPDEGWGAALVAADCVIGDHGSVTLYGAALDRPVLIGAFGEESVPGTAIAELARTAPRLGGGPEYRKRIDDAVDGHRPGLHDSAAELAFSHVGASARRLADLLYGLLELSPPTERGRVRTVAPARPESTRVTAFEVHAERSGPHAVTVERFPASVRRAEDTVAGATRHLSVSEDENDDTLARSASVVHRDSDDTTEAARAWTEAAIGRYPGALLTAARTPGGCVVRTRDGRVIRVTPANADAPADIGLLAALVYAVLRTGDTDELAGRYTLRAGEREGTCTLTVLRHPPATPGP